MFEESSNLDLAFKFADRRNAHSRKDLNAADRPDIKLVKALECRCCPQMVCEKRGSPNFVVGYQKQSARILADPQVVAEHYATE